MTADQIFRAAEHRFRQVNGISPSRPLTDGEFFCVGTASSILMKGDILLICSAPKYISALAKKKVVCQ